MLLSGNSTPRGDERPERDSRDKDHIGEWSAKVKIRLDIFVDTGRGGCYLFSMKVCVSE
jgi:hypothetical protein